MSNVGILMLIFATCILLVGLYMFTGHKLGIISWKVAFKNLTKEGWKNVGKWTMISSLLFYLIGIVAIIFNWE